MFISKHYIYIYIYEGEPKSNVFFFCIKIVTNTGICIIHQNEAGPM